MVTKILQTLYRIGTNDRKKQLFENNWPLPYGIAYNSYLILDKKTALLDTIEYGSDRNYLEEVSRTLDGRPLDYLVIHHMEPDHAGMIGDILKTYPSVTVVGNTRTLKLMDAYFPCTEGIAMQEVRDGEMLSLGYHNLQFLFTPMVHWPESMMSYCVTANILFSQDGFGSFGTLDGGIFDDEIDLVFQKEEMLRYYTNIIGRFSAQVQKALDKAALLPVQMICPIHGPVWRTDPATVFGWYAQWAAHKAEKGVVMVYSSMYGNTESSADYLARKLAEQSIKNLRIYNASTLHPSFILKEIWKYRGVILGSCSYNTGMHPAMQHLCHELEMVSPKNKQLAIFGGYSWSGGGLKNLQLFADKMIQQHQWKLTEPSLEIIGHPTPMELSQFDQLAETFAATL